MISSKTPTPAYINRIFSLAHTYRAKRTTEFKDKILINVFCEPNTHTSLSFESAMYRLGGNVINFNKELSSIKKGESFEDTIRTLSTYGDAIVLKHQEKGMIEKASKISTVPVINEEIDPEIYKDPRYQYFEQMEKGIVIRMAMLHHTFVDIINQQKMEEKNRARDQYVEIYDKFKEKSRDKKTTYGNIKSV